MQKHAHTNIQDLMHKLTRTGRLFPASIQGLTPLQQHYYAIEMLRERHAYELRRNLISTRDLPDGFVYISIEVDWTAGLVKGGRLK